MNSWCSEAVAGKEQEIPQKRVTHICEEEKKKQSLNTTTGGTIS